MSRLSPANPQCPRCKTKQNKTIIDQSFEMCIATSICLQLGHISRSYYMCDSIRTNARESQTLLLRNKVLIYTSYGQKCSSIHLILCFVQKKESHTGLGATRDMKMTEYIFLEIIKQTKMFLMKPERGFCPSI